MLNFVQAFQLLPRCPRKHRIIAWEFIFVRWKPQRFIETIRYASIILHNIGR